MDDCPGCVEKGLGGMLCRLVIRAVSTIVGIVPMIA